MLTPDQRWKRVKDLFELALEQMPTDLEAWLDQHGETDEQTRAEILSLFRHHTKAGSFLLQPIADRIPDLMADTPPLQPGQVVGKYEIVREIGRGGMGRVYLATDESMGGRSVALKTLAPELARNPEHRERLRREAIAAGRLSEPGICVVYEFFEETDGNVYIASEFLEGHTLRPEIEQPSRPTIAEIRQTAHTLARTLGAAHRAGITHRDFKPENVMRTTDGRLKVLDFGLASVEPVVGWPASIVGALTIPSAFMGTPAYMAPEQLLGGKADHRSDVFAFGLVLYEYACGVHPFAGDHPTEPATVRRADDIVRRNPVGIMARIVEREPAPTARYRPDLPASLIAIITRCLAKSPAERFPSAAELTAALASEVPEPERTPTPVASDRLTAWWRLHQLAAIALYFAACMVAWQAKEWQPGFATVLFMIGCIAATVGGMLRSHLLFTQRVTHTQLTAERRRWTPVLTGVDVTIASALLADGATLFFSRPVPAVLIAALGVGILMARMVFEPATTAATFRQSESA